MRVAIVHDWLNGMRGGEKVLEALLEIFPDSTIYTLFHEPGKASPQIESHPVVTSWLDGIPGIYRFYRNLLPLFPGAVEAWDFSGFDLVISSSHAVAKGIRPGNATHVCYCHTPMRYIWDAEADYRMNFALKNLFRLVRGRLRRWDCESSKRVDHFIANSSFVRDRIRRYYGRESVVVPPPIDTDFYFCTKETRSDFYLAVGALVPYKRLDVVVRSFNAQRRHLIVAGSGPQLNRLRAIAAPNVEVRGWVSNDELRRLYRSAKALVFAAREDFGIVAVEAQRCGCPVIAYATGGLCETVTDQVSGLFFPEQTELSLQCAVERFEGMTWQSERIAEGTERFSRGIFQGKIKQIIAGVAIPPSRLDRALQPSSVR